MKPCPQCGYSLMPNSARTMRKHFDAHSFECQRCLYRTETQPTWEDAHAAWEDAYARGGPSHGAQTLPRAASTSVIATEGDSHD
jgi:hypothetical protein